MTETIRAAGDIEEFLDALPPAKERTGGWYDTNCPVCGGKLSVREGSRDDLPVAQVRCWANECEQKAVYAALGFAHASPEPMASMTDWHDAARTGRRHVYTDASGAVVAIKVKQGKAVAWAEGNLAPVPMYRLRDCLNAAATGDWLYICEGEKDADILTEHFGVFATTLPNHAWTAELAGQVRGARIALVVDDDPTGAGYARRQPAALAAFGVDVARIALPVTGYNDIGECGLGYAAGRLPLELDAWLRDADPEALALDPERAERVSADADRIMERREALALVEARAADPFEIEVLSPEDLPDEKVEYLGQGWLQVGVTMVVSGGKGSFKTFVALGEACRIAAGLDGPARPVVYLYTEGASQMGARVRAFEAAHSARVGSNLLMINARRARIRLDIDGADERVVEAIREAVDARGIGDPALLVVDTLAKIRGAANEDKSYEMGPVMHRIELIRDALGDRATALVLHHPTKAAAGARGSGAIEDDVDVAATSKRGNGAMTVKITETRTKDAEERTYEFTLAHAGESLAVAGFSAHAADVDPDSVEMSADDKAGIYGQDILRAIRAGFGAHKQTELEKSLGFSHRVVSQACNSLHGKGLIRPAEASERPAGSAHNANFWIAVRGPDADA